MAIRVTVTATGRFYMDIKKEAKWNYMYSLVAAQVGDKSDVAVGVNAKGG